MDPLGNSPGPKKRRMGAQKSTPQKVSPKRVSCPFFSLSPFWSLGPPWTLYPAVKPFVPPRRRHRRRKSKHIFLYVWLCPLDLEHGCRGTVEVSPTERFFPWMSDRHYSYGDEDVDVMRPIGWASLVCREREWS